MLKNGESAWQFELNSNDRITNDYLYKVDNNVFNIVNLIVKGEIDRFAYKKIKDIYNNKEIEISFKKMCLKNTIKLYAKQRIGFLFRRLKELYD